ncbi:transketolase [Desulfobacterales bacterium HSG17]|nr:transketolase [Desulfobacterales bacterium HSG17]
MTQPDECSLNLETLCINTIRTLSMDAVQAANSGHPGAPMGLAAPAYVLWTRIMRHSPDSPDWPDRDRFVLSGGHASMLLYSMLHLCGYDLSLQDLKNFRQWGSKTPGHPEYKHTPGVETTTGPLGQGFTNAVGMAMAECRLTEKFGALVNHFTYCLCGDGDLMEGVASEAASLAGHLGLGKLIVLYDDNKISIEGGTDIAFTEDVGMRFKAYDWQVLKIEDGNDPDAVEKAVLAAQKETTRPTMIMVRTRIAHGSPNLQDSCNAHGAPLGEEEVRLTKENLGCPPDEIFCIPDEAKAHFVALMQERKAAMAEWEALATRCKDDSPAVWKEFETVLSGTCDLDWNAVLPQFEPDAAGIASRASSGQVLNAIAGHYPWLWGGSADLAPSNKTQINGEKDFQKFQYDGRNIRFGVREHAMGGIMNGMALHGGIKPYGGTFLVFADYMRGAIRLAALMQIPVIYVFTHDSVAVGEDGPTHQPVEHVLSLRAIPGLTVLRPGDANEVAQSWKIAMTNTGPTALILSRQKLPTIDRAVFADAENLTKGAYIVNPDVSDPKLQIIATGSELGLSMAAAAKLAEEGISTQVVSMPSWELFAAQDDAYQKSVLPTGMPRLAVEAGSSMGWHKFTGDAGDVLGIDKFGTSAPGGKVLAEYGFTVETVMAKAKALLS